MALAEKVRVKREEKRMTQSKLAKKSGLTQATISRIESGEVKQLKSEAIKALAKALDVTEDFLMGDMPRMSFDETLRADDTAQVIFRGYEKLSEEKRRDLKDYVTFMVDQERKKKSQ